MNNSDNRRWALVGLVTVALWIAGVFLVTQNQPGDHATDAQILAFYKSNTNTILFGGWLFMLGCLGLVTFVSGLRMRFADVMGERSQLPGLAFAGAVMTGVLGMIFAATDVGGAIDKTDISPATAGTFHHLGDVFFVCAELAAMLPIGVVAIVAWRTRVLPRWWAVFSGLLVILLLIGPVGWIGLIFGLPIWTLGTSLFFLLRSRAPMRTAAAAA
jgi:uncharacterized membrane protein YozB (DUF420 family)